MPRRPKSFLSLVAILGVVVVAAATLTQRHVVASSASPAIDDAPGACSQWNVSGSWQVSQSNNYSPVLNLQQNGTTITGTMTFSPDDQTKGNYVTSSGTLTGTINGNQLQFLTSQMAKHDGSASQGQYSGTVSQGQITNGTAKDVLHPGSTATWSATGSAVCPGAASSGPSGPSGANGPSATSAASQPASSAPATVLAPAWAEQEFGGACNATWTRQGGGNTFAMSQNCPGLSVTATLAISVNGSQVSIARTNSSDGNNCSYQGNLSADGKSMNGTYKCPLVQPPPPGSWSATAGTAAAGPAPGLPAQGQACDLTGKWAWSEGSSTATFTQTGNQVTGDDGGDQVSGALSGNQFNGSWQHGSDTGALNWTMSNDCSSFSGTFGWPRGRPADSLNGKRLSGPPAATAAAVPSSSASSSPPSSSSGGPSPNPGPSGGGSGLPPAFSNPSPPGDPTPGWPSPFKY